MEISIRFCCDFVGGGFFPQAHFGWFFDDIVVTDSVLLVGISAIDLDDVTSFIFRPGEEATALLQIQVQNGQRLFPFGPGIVVEVEQGSPGGQSVAIDDEATVDEEETVTVLDSGQTRSPV